MSRVFDGSFEVQNRDDIGSPWFTEGSDWKGIDRRNFKRHTGDNNAFTWSTGRQWNAILQTVPVTPNTEYELTGWVNTSDRVNAGFFGARQAGFWPPPGVPPPAVTIASPPPGPAGPSTAARSRGPLGTRLPSSRQQPTAR
ncbi:hypothetical protein [Streptosporangium carneum]|uniref:CBM-cenC domain-containing protein n=1 Tax=Streptosporangium carneum TaxID=47481 RepID=A0A9W6I1T3_9ACTN|nr:hypothetical protein [Streptosporangium carneum]GLK09653.1 hypothetical protein GCM10017600_30590 [Streptosporangium carneum]